MTLKFQYLFFASELLQRYSFETIIPSIDFAEKKKKVRLEINSRQYRVGQKSIGPPRFRL